MSQGRCSFPQLLTVPTPGPPDYISQPPLHEVQPQDWVPAEGLRGAGQRASLDHPLERPTCHPSASASPQDRGDQSRDERWDEGAQGPERMQGWNAGVEPDAHQPHRPHRTGEARRTLQAWGSSPEQEAP